tara:strand:- start:1808 stop:1981 length:174 start_codon:yes stop_codon:yes gene_type:complete
MAILSVVLIVEGVIPFLYPSRFRTFISYILELDDNTIRIIGGICLLLGIILAIIIIS